MMLEAKCSRCGETYTPADMTNLIHLYRLDGTECEGTPAYVLGTLDEGEMAETSPTPETSTGYFSGDWEYADMLDCYETAFAAIRFGEPWNGFCTPVVTREVADALVARQQMLVAAGAELDAMRWDGNGIRVQYSDYDEAVDGDTETQWLLPDEEGNFDLGQLGYTFYRLDDDDNVIRKVG